MEETQEEYQVTDFIEEENKDEKQDINQNKPPKKPSLVLKIVCLVLGVTAIAGAGTALVSLFLRNNNESSSGNYLTFDSKSINECMEVYNQFGKAKQKKAGDFAFLGSKLFFSESKITPTLLKNVRVSNDYSPLVGEGKNLYLYSLSSSISRESGYQSDFANGNYFIDFTNIPKGDYLIYSDTSTSIERKDFNPYSLSYKGVIDYTVYTLPNEDGARKTVRLRNNPASPFTLISVRNVDTIIPDDYYDAVLFDAQYENQSGTIVGPKDPSNSDRLSLLNTLATTISDKSRFKIKVCDSLQAAIEVKSTLSFALQSDENITLTSLYLENKYDQYTSQVLTDTELVNYDLYPEIREPLGYLGKAGENHSGVVGNNTFKIDDSHVGKESFLIHNNESISSRLSAILNQQ